MIDCHTHILPAFDDGATDLEVALELIYCSHISGVKEIFVTPHGLTNPVDAYEEHREILTRFTELQAVVRASKLPVRLHLGMEVYVTAKMIQSFNKKQLFFMGESNYLLVEFPFESTASFMTEALVRLMREGVLPLVAHPERYAAVQEDPALVYQWNQIGICTQGNSGSLFGQFGEEAFVTLCRLLDNNLIQVLATDCHDLQVRVPNLRKATEFITTHYSKGLARLLTEVNPKLLVQNEELLIVNPKNPWG